MDCRSAQNVLAKSRRLVLVSRNLLRLLAERINGTERITHPTREAPGSHYGRPETMHGLLHHA